MPVSGRGCQSLIPGPDGSTETSRPYRVNDAVRGTRRVEGRMTGVEGASVGHEL
jgi:hypothetical protein